MTKKNYNHSLENTVLRKNPLLKRYPKKFLENTFASLTHSIAINAIEMRNEN